MPPVIPGLSVNVADAMPFGAVKYVLLIAASTCTILILPFFVMEILLFTNTDYGCKDTLLTETTSPNQIWKAQVIESLCESTFVTDITAGVHVKPVNGPGLDTDILGVDTGGNSRERPRIAWTAPNVLQVTVPNISYLKVLTREFDGVRIDLRYDPDDPAARAAWRKSLGEPLDLDEPR